MSEKMIRPSWDDLRAEEELATKLKKMRPFERMQYEFGASASGYVCAICLHMLRVDQKGANSTYRCERYHKDFAPKLTIEQSPRFAPSKPGCGAYESLGAQRTLKNESGVDDVFPTTGETDSCFAQGREPRRDSAGAPGGWSKRR